MNAPRVSVWSRERSGELEKIGRVALSEQGLELKADHAFPDVIPVAEAQQLALAILQRWPLEPAQPVETAQPQAERPSPPSHAHKRLAVMLERALPRGWRYVLVVLEPTGPGSGRYRPPSPDYEMRTGDASLQSNADNRTALAVLDQVAAAYRKVGFS